MNYYKSAVLMQIRNEKKQAINEEKTKKNTEELTKKLEKMSPEQRQMFVDELTTKLRVVKAELKDLRIDEEKRKQVLFELERNSYKMSDKLKFGIIYSSALLGYFAGIITTGILIPETLVGLSIGVIAGSAVVGLGLGALGTYIYNSKIISKISSKLKLRNARLKLAKVTKLEEKLESQIKSAQEIER